jgi:uncharacterized alpha-E superfamily protein
VEEDFTAPAIAEFLILDRRMPRSLSFSAGQIVNSLSHLEDDYGNRLPSHDMADALRARLVNRDIHSIFDEGLHEFTTALIDTTAKLAQQIEVDYRFTG